MPRNTTPKNANSNDPFWEKSETALLQALILYLVHEAPEEERNFGMVMEMLQAAEVREEEEDFKSDLDYLFEDLAMRNPDHIAVKQYGIFKMAAGKTAKSILVSVGVRLATFNLSDVVRILDDFSELNRTMMLTIDMVPVPTDEAVKRSTMQLDKVEANVLRYNQRQQANSNFSGALPHDMEIQRKEAKEFLEDLTTRDQRMLMCCMTLVHMADSKEEMERDTESLFSIARNHLCQMSTLRYQQADGLNTVLPYGVRMIEALRTMTTESTAVMIPFKTQELHDTTGICYGHNIISKNLLVINRKNLLNGNGFVFGVSGSGKSFITKEELVNNALNTDDEIIIIDPEQEYGRLVRALGGEVIIISATSPNHINAMDVSREYGDVENPIILKSEFILSLCEMAVGTGTLNAKEKSLIGVLS